MLADCSDVKAIMVNNKHKDDAKVKQLVEEFANKNFCNVVWMPPGV